jgi:7-cyano-7-deazaguanine synthase
MDPSLADLAPPSAGRGCVLLLSGGMDSTVLLAALRAAGWRVAALTVLYGQRHAIEVDCARAQAAIHGCTRHEVLELPAAPFAASALTGSRAAPPAGAVPPTYVPARNLVLLSLGSAWAESQGLADVFIAVNAVDYSGYPDCRPEFVEAFDRAARLGTRDAVSVHAPMVGMSKARIVSAGAAFGVDLARTCSCYRPDAEGRACGRCDACALRRRGFETAGVEDATLYAEAAP